MKFFTKKELWGSIVILFALALAAHFLYSWMGFNPTDDGFTLAYSRRILAGQVPHRDFIINRPFLSPLLHIIDILIASTSVLWISRLFVWIQFAFIAWTWIVFIKNSQVPYVFSIILIIFAFAAGVTTFPIMAWHTIDGLFFIMVGLVLYRSDKNMEQLLGCAALGAAPLCKQSFLIVPLLLIILGGWKNPKKWMALFLPGFLYLAYLSATGSIPAALAQLTAITKLSVADSQSSPTLTFNEILGLYKSNINPLLIGLGAVLIFFLLGLPRISLSASFWRNPAGIALKFWDNLSSRLKSILDFTLGIIGSVLVIFTWTFDPLRGGHNHPGLNHIAITIAGIGLIYLGLALRVPPLRSLPSFFNWVAYHTLWILPSTILVISLLNNTVYRNSFLLFSLLAGCVIYFLFSRTASSQRNVQIGLIALIIGFSVSISDGYPTPMLSDGIMISCLFFYAWQYLPFSKGLPVFLPYIFPGIALAALLFGFNFARNNYIYRDLSSNKLSCRLDGIFPGANYLRTAPKTCLMLQDLKTIVARVESSGKKYAILPDIAAWWVAASQPNPLLIDWSNPSELNNPVVLSSAIENINFQKRNLVFILTKYETRSISWGKVKINKPYPLLLYVKNNFKKVGETDYFTIYQSP